MARESAHDCLGCGAALAAPFIDLGLTPLANSYVRPEFADRPEERFPLAVCYCSECHLVQITSVVPPEKLFSQYAYFSSYSQSLLDHAREMAESLMLRLSLDSNSRVLEIASNDGYLLQYFQRRGIRVMGVEPAANIAATARERGIPTISAFFGRSAIEQVLTTFGLADLIIGNNVLAHVPAITEFLGAVSAVMKPFGVAVFEFPYLKELLDHNEFDTIYHEHVFYYSMSALWRLADRAGLEVYDVVNEPIHGGSLRVFLRRAGGGPISSRVSEMLIDEAGAGLTSAARYYSFGRSAVDVKRQLVGMIDDIRSLGGTLGAYGAPAKGNTLLTYCGIDSSCIAFTVDRNPHKQGLLLPGSHIPILPPDALVERRPDYALILPWNIATEIIGQQREYLERGGQFIIPIPWPQVI